MEIAGHLRPKALKASGATEDFLVSAKDAKDDSVTISKSSMAEEEFNPIDVGRNDGTISIRQAGMEANNRK